MATIHTRTSPLLLPCDGTKPMTPMTNSTAWQALKQHCQKIAPLHLRELLTSDPKRFDQLKLQLSSGNGNLLIDI